MTDTNLFRGAVWAALGVEQQPSIVLVRWRIIQVKTKDMHIERYFVGYNLQDREGRVSTAIQQFDALTRRGVTKSGRVYQLEGEPGFDPDGEYVWRICATAWLFIDEKDVTAEVIKQIKP